MFNKCLSGWKCCIVPKTTGQFQQSKVYKTSISPHVFLNRATHSAKNKRVFFRYVHIWPYKKLQTKPVAYDFDETFLRSVSFVTALILKQSNFCYVELKGTVSRLRARASVICFFFKRQQTCQIDSTRFPSGPHRRRRFVVYILRQYFKLSKKSFVLFKIWLAARRLIAILSLAGPPRDPKISFRSL